MSAWLTPRNAVVVALIAMMALLPVYAAVTGNTFTMTLFTRIMILAIAAVSLNLIMGYGGMVSFGHAAYLGIGGYVVGILANKTVFYYVCLALLLGAILLVWRIVNSRFGMVIRGARSNERRMRSIGFPVYRYRLACFVIAGILCGLAGVLLANHTSFISPALMQWTRSGDLIVMVVLGGMGSAFGPLIGTVALLVLEEALSGVTEYSQIIVGPLLLLVVLYARGGIDGMLRLRHA